MKIRNPHPRYTHDCDHCKYLGSITFPAPHRETMVSGEEKRWTETFAADLYVCVGQPRADKSDGTIIARWASEGSHYASSDASTIREHYMRSELSTMGPALIAGYWFAVAARHITHLEVKR